MCGPCSPIVLLVLLGQGIDDIAGALVAEDRLEVLVLRLLDLAGGLVELRARDARVDGSRPLGEVLLPFLGLRSGLGLRLRLGVRMGLLVRL